MRPLLLLLLLAAVGCELPESATEEQTSTPPPAASPDPAATPVADAGQAEWDAITWHTASGPACPGAVPVMSLSATIIDNNSKISFTYDRYPWTVLGVVHFFVWTGTHWDGGKFDNIQIGGQPVKLTENILAGYNGLSAPPSGSPVAFAWTNPEGTERSNLAKTTWP